MYVMLIYTTCTSTSGPNWVEGGGPTMQYDIYAMVLAITLHRVQEHCICFNINLTV